VFDAAKQQAIVQYLLALDYLSILSQRYPDPDRLKECNFAFECVVAKIDELMPKPPPPLHRKTLDIISTVVAMFVVVSTIGILTK